MVLSHSQNLKFRRFEVENPQVYCFKTYLEYNSGDLVNVVPTAEVPVQVYL